MKSQDKIGKYELEKLVGEGGMGEVWLSHDPDLGIPVAIKTLYPHLRESDPIFVQRFVQEATHAARLNHPNIARIYAAGCENDVNFIVMEYLPGGTAEKLIGDPPDKSMLAQIRKTIVESTEGLTAAARAGIVHRDVKPANILFDEHGTAKLADLGIGKGLGSTVEEQSLTMTGHVVGTPFYMAPEQATAAKYVDTRSDVYALGATWYHLATGTVPFDGETSVGIMLRHVQDERPDPRELNPALPKKDAVIIQKMMACDPTDRFQTPQELLDALNGDFEMPKTEKGGKPMWLIGAAAGVIATIAIVVLLAMRGGSDPAEALDPVEPPVVADASPATEPPPVAVDATAPVAAVETPVAPEQPEAVPPLSATNPPNSINTAFPGMVLIKPGEFAMGSDNPAASDNGEPASPTHRVRISQPFQMAKSPVTKTDFARFCHTADYRTTAERAGQAEHYGASGWQQVTDANWRTGSTAHNHPVVNVSWDDATAYCRWLTQRDAKKLPSGYTYRLPTEAEWEYACRAGTTTAFSFGDAVEKFADYANCRDQASGLPLGGRWFEKTAEENDGHAVHAPVASLQANPWGLFDMHGNVWEWCFDGPREYETGTVDSPLGPQGERRVFRGGSWDSAPSLSRSAYRFAMGARRAANNLGFRVVLAKQP